MKRLLPFFILFFWAFPVHGGEVHLRMANHFGVMGRMQQNVFNQAFKKFIITNPEGSLEVQFSPHWFGSFSFSYARVRDKPFTNAGGTRVKGHANLWMPSVGVKIVSSAVDPSTGDFFDDTRWWFGAEAGPYITEVNSPIIGGNKDIDIGFNIGAGFDYFFKKHWGVGIETKTHYAHYSPDDYILFMFGPHLLYRF